MKTLFLLCIAILTLLGCHGQSATNAVKGQQATNAELAEMKAKGQVPSSDGGWTMTATIN
jgi:uncharacterized lipoprotein NlpE involved in copper resistance